MSTNYQKYLKYKLKYLDLKTELEGGSGQVNKHKLYENMHTDVSVIKSFLYTQYQNELEGGEYNDHRLYNDFSTDYNIILKKHTKELFEKTNTTNGNTIPSILAQSYVSLYNTTIEGINKELFLNLATFPIITVGNYNHENFSRLVETNISLLTQYIDYNEFIYTIDKLKTLDNFNIKKAEILAILNRNFPNTGLKIDDYDYFNSIKVIILQGLKTIIYNLLYTNIILIIKDNNFNEYKNKLIIILNKGLPIINFNSIITNHDVYNSLKDVISSTFTRQITSNIENIKLYQIIKDQSNSLKSDNIQLFKDNIKLIIELNNCKNTLIV